MLTAALRPNAYLAESTNHMLLSLINRENAASLYRFDGCHGLTLQPFRDSSGNR